MSTVDRSIAANVTIVTILTVRGFNAHHPFMAILYLKLDKE